MIEFKDILLLNLRNLGCKTKSDAEKLSDDLLFDAGLKNSDLIKLFRRFLTIYDPMPQKFKEIEKITSDCNMKTAFKELYFLPGAKQIRANLYYLSGYKSLNDFINKTEDEIITRIALTISKYGLTSTAPLPKEIRTHIAVAKAFSMT